VIRSSARTRGDAAPAGEAIGSWGDTFDGDGDWPADGTPLPPSSGAIAAGLLWTPRGAPAPTWDATVDTEEQRTRGVAAGDGALAMTTTTTTTARTTARAIRPARAAAPTAPSRPAASEPRPGQLLAGRYRLDHRLAVGGFGAVFAAEDRRLDKTVAIKVLSPHIAGQPEHLQRFRREAIAASQIGHGGIVSITDFDRDAGGAHFIVMELLDGCDLAELLHRDGALRRRARS